LPRINVDRGWILAFEIPSTFRSAAIEDALDRQAPLAAATAARSGVAAEDGSAWDFGFRWRLVSFRPTR
jgi:hypothetical protein